jgi:LmbE family N-acetylglucosaminyl deacetylase
MIVVSPHFDDAVFGCGALIAGHPGARVVTVFAGLPRDAARCTEWDARSGFADAREAIAQRRREDRRALALLKAQPLWLDFADAQYGESPGVEDVASVLRQLLRPLSPDTLLYPLGLFHSDHLLVHEACRAALPALPGLEPLAYEDALYRARAGLLQQRLAELAVRGVRATPARPVPPSGVAPLKAQAVQAYASQLRALGPDAADDTARPERYWALEAVAGPGTAEDGRRH